MRQACDRCHAKKTKCPKHPGASSCIRCAKAGAVCTFSPTTTRSNFRPYEPPAEAPFSSIDPQSTRWDHRWQQQNGNGFNEHMMHEAAPAHDPFQPWSNPSELPVDPSLNLADSNHEMPMDPSMGAAPVDPSLSMDTQLVDPSLSAPPEKAGTQQQRNGRGDPGFEGAPDVEKLMDVTMALDSMARSYPSKKLHQIPQDDAQRWVTEVTGLVDLKMRLEKSLEYTTHLDELYPSIIRLAAPGKEQQIANDDSTEDAISPPSTDYALLNVLVACHTKLLDMLELLLGHGKMCGKVLTQLPKEDKERTYDVPEIRIGSVLPPKEKASSYYIMFIADFLDTLSQRIKGLESLPVSDEEPERESKILNLQCEILKDRTEGLVKGLVGLNELMTSQGIIH